MRLLICTQVVDSQDPVLGFFHRWVEEFAKHCSVVHVICLRVGNHNLPDNVFVHSLGKEKGGGRLFYIWRFYKYACSLRHDYDSVFVHMNPEYVVLMGLVWRLWQKKIMQWYSHRSVTIWLKISNLLSHQIFSTSKHAMRLKSNKVRFVGHGIDLERFNLLPVPEDPKRILYVGRITPIKRIELMLEAFIELNNRGQDVLFDIVGDLGSEKDKVYKEKLLAMIPVYLNSKVAFHGSVPQYQINKFLGTAHAFYNFSPSGGMDKVVLEAMACGIAPVVTNEAFIDFLKNYKDLGVFGKNSIEALVKATENALVYSKNNEVRGNLRNAVATKASLDKLIIEILK